ncbi:SDR family NAD(P)-dependent oxidoreductase [Limobrevibacterium gyesilva]|uniref:SDR family NAD(P)-dependent oxidoreductase n=1 Tax=Limobrevibacterium gyesilva TaxID=2991712 RepID=A0AA41YRP1_9PROT|nr:SDR family NAD(P)-dependent oxidoreductase [Limobrevibacterium gyesilva]MCW3475358.1 SDR family NAD(P)-dependent oxidoreductase [Limobrevibacterium gyesilva]
METGIAGRVALVTGASSGLGRRFAQVLAREGAALAIGARRTDRLEALAGELRAAGGRVITLAIDVTSTASVREAAAAVEQQLGPIEILVNNAGVSRQARLEDVEEDAYDAVMDTNLKGAFFMAQAAARQMIRHRIEGRIVNIASVAALRTLGQLGVYCMSKAGVTQMTHVMAREWARHGINTNAICPGYIATEISADFLQTEAGQRMVQGLPRRRMGEPQDLDGLLLLLCAREASRFINGAVIAADDGFTSF